MAGLNVLYSRNTDFNFLPDKIRFLHHSSGVLLAENESYPSRKPLVWEYNNYLIAFDGRIFGEADTKQYIQEFANDFFESVNPAAIADRYWTNKDAEFILILLNRTDHSIIVLNDVLGRFPFYIAETERYYVITRDLSFAREYVPMVADKFGCMEALCFGFSLGNKTIYKGVSRVPPATIIELKNHQLRQIRYKQINFQELERKTFLAKDFDLLTETFNQGLYDRIAGERDVIVSLSGGLDSRAVVGGLLRLGSPFCMYSFNDYRHTIKDVATAGTIAKTIGKKLQVIDLPEIDSNLVNQLLAIKNGISDLDLAPLIHFYQHLNNRYGYAAVLTGDGGDKVFPDLHPPLILKNFQSYVHYLIDSNRKFDTQSAAALTGVEPDYIYEELKNLLRSYPEQDPSFKSIHFIFENRVRNWLFEGEDRNRWFVQTLTPFYSIPFFWHAMSYPSREKKLYKLFDAFLRHQSRELYGIPNANWGFNTGENQKLTRLFRRQQLKHIPFVKDIQDAFRLGFNYLNHLTDKENTIWRPLITGGTPVFNSDIKKLTTLKQFSQENFYQVVNLFRAFN